MEPAMFLLYPRTDKPNTSYRESLCCIGSSVCLDGDERDIQLVQYATSLLNATKIGGAQNSSKCRVNSRLMLFCRSKKVN